MELSDQLMSEVCEDSELLLVGTKLCLKALDIDMEREDKRSC